MHLAAAKTETLRATRDANQLKDQHHLDRPSDGWVF